MSPARRIAVFGTSGSGKSVLARRIGAALDLPVIELDAINWQPGWRGLNAHDPELFKARVAEAISGESWVTDGNYSEVRPMILARMTDMIWLDYARSLVMARVIRRSLARALSNREIWPGTGNKERFSNWLDPNTRSAGPGRAMPGAARAMACWRAASRRMSPSIICAIRAMPTGWWRRCVTLGLARPAGTH